MSYVDKNGLAKWWERDHVRLEGARWVYHHPEIFQALVDRLKEHGIDIFNNEPTDDNPTYNVDIVISAIAGLTDEEIDEITGVDLNAE